MIKLPDYLHYENQNLFINKINIIDIIKKYGESLEIINLDTIDGQINKMKDYFNDAIKKHQYDGKYHYAYASKANYESHILKKAVSKVNFVETSSANDLFVINYLFDTNFISDKYTIICNGFKTPEYISLIVKMKKKGINIIPIMENEQELNNFISLDMPFKIGIRFDVDFYKNKIVKYPEESRFGFLYPEFLKYISRIQKSKLSFEVFHFHMNGTINSNMKYVRLLKNLFVNNYIPLSKKFPTLKYFDIGGGMPINYLLNEEDDVKSIVFDIVNVLSDSCIRQHIKMPDIIGEHGRFTVADTTFNVFKVNFVKKIKKDLKWYVLNNSIVNTLPDTWICRQPFTVLPINLIENNLQKVMLGGPTCDPDDVYYYQENKPYLMLPEIKPGQSLYIGFFKTGAYQLMERGTGARHCLISEPAKILIEDGNVTFLKEKQNGNDILRYLGYK